MQSNSGLQIKITPPWPSLLTDVSQFVYAVRNKVPCDQVLLTAAFVWTPRNSNCKGYTTFLPIDKVKDDTAGFVKNSTAIIGVHLSFNQTEAITKEVLSCCKPRTNAQDSACCHQHTSVQVQRVAESGPHNFSTLHLRAFRSLYNDAAFSDVVIKAGRVGLKAHKAFLAAHSPTFKAIFEVTLLSVCFANLSCSQHRLPDESK